MVSKASVILVVLLIASGTLFAATVFVDNGNKNSEPDVLNEFLEICKVPRYSGYEEKMEDYLIDIAEKYDYPWEKDSVGNVLIDHPGKKATGMILQAHMDMVAVQNDGIIHDWKNDPIETTIEDGFIHAMGTSLGADDGAGLAIIVSALKSDSLRNYSFRCIFTVDEEESMTGAHNIQGKWFDGFQNVVNIDMIDQDQFCIGSAGMFKETVTSAVQTTTQECDAYSLDIHGFNGGHSGIKIGENANVIMLVFEFLKNLNDDGAGVRMISFESGTAHNAIPNSASVRFAVSSGYDVSGIYDSWKSDVENKYKENEPDMYISITNPVRQSVTTWGEEISSKLIDAVNSCPSGVRERSEEGVLLSMNYGIISIDGGDITISISSRGADETKSEELKNAIVETFAKCGFDTEVYKQASSWLESAEEPFVKKAVKIYTDDFGKAPVLSVLHGATENGEFRNLVPGLHIISVGPTMFDEHSTAERMDVRSLELMKNFVFDLIKNV